MGDKLTFVHVEATGHVLGVLSRRTGDDEDPTPEQAVGEDGFLFRGSSAGESDVLVPTDRLAVATIELPQGTHVDAPIDPRSFRIVDGALESILTVQASPPPPSISGDLTVIPGDPTPNIDKKVIVVLQTGGERSLVGEADAVDGLQVTLSIPVTIGIDYRALVFVEGEVLAFDPALTTT